MTGKELFYIVLSIATLAIAFTNFFGSYEMMFGLVVGFTLHEMAHKFTAQFYGFHSEYQVWGIGLLLVLVFGIISNGKLIFAAPGYVVTEGNATIKERGIISMAGPFTNLLLCAVFLYSGASWAVPAAQVNLFLGFFNFLPFGPLDGSKVIQWNVNVWLSCTLFSLILGLFVFL